MVTSTCLAGTPAMASTTAGGTTYRDASDQTVTKSQRRHASARRTRGRHRHKRPLLAAAPTPPIAQTTRQGQSATLMEANTGGQQYGAPNPAFAQTVPGSVAKILPNGLAAAPADAPAPIQQAIWAANKIIGLPYIWGGGHQSFQSRGYDCSGTVSYALHGGGLLDSPLDSSSFMSWGRSGAGQWFTVYTNPGHAYLVIAGIRLDTSAVGDPGGGSGPRWRPAMRSSRGFRARHLLGL